MSRHHRRDGRIAIEQTLARDGVKAVMDEYDLSYVEVQAVLHSMTAGIDPSQQAAIEREIVRLLDAGVQSNVAFLALGRVRARARQEVQTQ